jgi:hypothetical protein
MVQSEGNMSLKNPVTPPGIDPGTVRLVAQRLNQYATPGPFVLYSAGNYTRRQLYQMNVLLFFLVSFSVQASLRNGSLKGSNLYSILIERTSYTGTHNCFLDRFLLLEPAGSTLL